MIASANLAASGEHLRAAAADAEHNVDRSVSEAATVLRGVVDGLRASQALFVAAQLRIADHLARGPLDGHALGDLTGTNPIALRRVMRALFDLPNVVRRAPDALRQNEVEHRCLIEGGSFFERVPHGDIYLLKHILHDWDDERATAILSCCRRYMPATAKLLVIERRLPERAEPGVLPDAFLVDLEMLVMTSGGRERTEGQLRSLFAAAGFQHERTIPTASGMSMFEARPL